MPEPQGWTRVDEPTGWKLVEKAKPVEQPSVFDRALSVMGDSRAGPLINAGSTVMRFAKDHPAEAGAVAGAGIGSLASGGLLTPVLAPWAAGILGAGVGAAGGAGVGISGRQLATGTPEAASDTLGTMGKEGLTAAAIQAGFGVAPPVARFLLRAAPIKTATTAAEIASHVGVPGAGPVATGLRMLQRFRGAADALPSAANAGGRLVTGTKQPIESVIGDALSEVRAPVKPDVITLPPEPRLPAGYTPRTSVPEPSPVAAPTPSPNAGGRLAHPTTPAAMPQTANPERAIAEALTELQQPAARPAVTRIARTATPPTPPAQELPASWKRLVEPPKAAPPRDTAPLGLSDDAPMWSRGGSVENDARDMRGAMGAEDAGALMDMPADDVRALSGAPKRRPLVADLAEMDRGYMRQLANPLAGVALGVPTADVLRRALIEALSKHGAPSPQ